MFVPSKNYIFSSTNYVRYLRVHMHHTTSRMRVCQRTHWDSRAGQDACSSVPELSAGVPRLQRQVDSHNERRACLQT